MEKKSNKVIKVIFTLLFITYLLLLIYLTFFSAYFRGGLIERRINIVPFKTIFQYIINNSNFDIMITNLAGNIVAFMPMGFLIPIVFSSLNKVKKVLGIVFLFTALIEIGQYVTMLGIFDIDDIILNILGGIVGYWIFKLYSKIKELLTTNL